MRRAAQAGFSLLEVLIALCIVAIAFGAIYRAQAQGISMTGEARDVTYAGLLAQQRMSELTSTLPAYGLRRGDFSPEFPDFRWEERVTGYKEFDAEMRHVQVSVFWGPGDEARTLTLEAYVLEPAEVEEEEAEGEGEAKEKEGGAGKEKEAAKPGGQQPTGEGGEEEEE